MKVVLDPRAIADLEHIHDFIAVDSPATAAAVVERILASIERLGEFPSMARSGPTEGTREWVIPRLPYIAVYKVDVERDVITVVAVFHGAQRRDDE